MSLLKKDLYVKVYFKTGILVEGLVFELEPLTLKLDNEYFILPSYSEVLFLKVSEPLNNKKQIEKKIKVENEISKIKDESSEELQVDHRLLKLVELQQELSKIDKDIIKNKLIDHSPGQLSSKYEDKYGTPRLDKM